MTVKEIAKEIERKASNRENIWNLAFKLAQQAPNPEETYDAFRKWALTMEAIDEERFPLIAEAGKYERFADFPALLGKQAILFLQEKIAGAGTTITVEDSIFGGKAVAKETQNGFLLQGQTQSGYRYQVAWNKAKRRVWVHIENPGKSREFVPSVLEWALRNLAEISNPLLEWAQSRLPSFASLYNKFKRGEEISPSELEKFREEYCKRREEKKGAANS